MFYCRYTILLIASNTHAKETKGLSLSPIIEKVLIIPENPSLKPLIKLGQVLLKYVLRQIDNIIKVSIL